MPDETNLVLGFYFYCSYGLQTDSLKPHHSIPTFSFIDRAHLAYRFYMIDSCNGLVLCSHGIINCRLYSVSNLTTQKYTEILEPPSKKNGSILLSCLAFDPTRSIHYRVLIIRQEDTGLYDIDMYFSGDKSWKRVYAEGEPCGIVNHMVFWDGAVHWLDEKGSTHLQFDVDTEKLVETLLPSKACDGFRFCYLGECGGDLILVESELDFTRGYKIHEMIKGTRHWNLKQWVHIRTLQDMDLLVLGVLKRSHLSDMELVLHDGRKVYSYNTKLTTMKVLYISFRSDRPGRPSSSADFFIERFYPV